MTTRVPSPFLSLQNKLLAIKKKQQDETIETFVSVFIRGGKEKGCTHYSNNLEAGGRERGEMKRKLEKEAREDVCAHCRVEIKMDSPSLS